jgi:hypothetical protein
MKRSHLVVKGAEATLEGIVGKRPLGDLDIAGGNIDCDDVVSVAGKFERNVAGAASDIEYAQAVPAVPRQKIKVAVDYLADVQTYEEWVAPEALVKMLALDRPAQIRNKSDGNSLIDTFVEGGGFRGNISDIDCATVARHYRQLADSHATRMRNESGL